MSFKHKHKTSEVAGDLSFTGLDGTSGEMQRQESTSLIASPTQSSATTFLRKASSKGLAEKGPTEQSLHATADSSGMLGPESVEAVFSVRGSKVRATITRVGLQLTALKGPLLSCLGRAALGLLPFEEILSAEAEPRSALWRSTCCTGRTHVLIVHTIKRAHHDRCQWKPQTIRLTTADAELARSWAARISTAAKSSPQRPRSLLVIVNPYGGAKQAMAIWQRVGAPTFQRAGVRYSVLVTEREGHAREVVEQLPLEELKTHDGIVAVGGDGLFQEILNGVLMVRAAGGPLGAAAFKLRLGHIPAGSTDAVAYSLNGTRSTTTAALHIAIGDRMPIDIMRVDTGDGQHRFAACVASYGYMGDLMRFSEKLRWMGPPRYNTAGTVTLLRGRAYRARVSYKPVDARRFSEDVRVVCRSHCNLCQASKEAHGAVDSAAFTRPATRALEHGAWKTIEGDFKGIMVVVSPCRSDRSTLGLFPYSHLSDGRLHLILVQNCSVLQYLRFLASIPLTGVQPDAFPYVKVVDATAVHVEPIGRESCWNVDGEILGHNNLAGEVHRGLLEVFARGIE